MKKHLFKILLGMFGVMITITPVIAATSVLLAPIDVNVRQGETFNLTTSINPQGIKSYTVKTELRYPADLLEVKSFFFANNWTPLAQPGYDLIDNTNGILIKTAGFPGGASSTLLFGTISFLAKKSGTGAIILDSGNSLVLDTNNQNIIAGELVQTIVTASAPVLRPPTSQTSKPLLPLLPLLTIKEVDTLKPETSVIQEKTIVSQPVPPRSLLSPLGATVTLGTNSVVIGVLVIMVIFVLIVYAVYFFKKWKWPSLN